MKISKLFHWLYASLMLLPILIFVPNAFYYGFNEYATNNQETEVVNTYYDTNEVDDFDDLVNGNAYLIDIGNVQFDGFVIYIEKYELLDITLISTRTATTQRQTPFIGNRSGNIGISLFTQSTGGSGINNALDFYGKVAFVYDSYDTLLTQSTICDYIYPYSSFYKGQETIYVERSITDSMSYAWESVWQNDLFSWSYGSFLTEPFIYIGNLFNVPVDNTLYYALSYWLDISIIWLCFDLVMYIPLLVHRWLDKGIIE